MSVYGWILIGAISGPLLFSFFPPVYFYRKWKHVFTAIFATAIPFLVWDILVTARGDWAFNPKYVSPVPLFGLPLEEVLFFVVIPYAVIFLYEVAKFFWQEKDLFSVKAAQKWGGVTAALFLVASILTLSYSYTSLVLLLTGLCILVVTIFRPQLWSSRRFWITQSLTIVGFFVINYLLTSWPVVVYNTQAITNARILTIPVEDVVYNFLLVVVTVLAYKTSRTKIT